MARKYIYIFFFCLLLVSGCGVGGMNEEEDDSGTSSPTYYVQEDICRGEPEFAYNFTQTSEDTSFQAYGRTQFRLIHYGMCDYVMSLLVVSTNATYELLNQGFGNSNVLRVYDLPDENYFLSVETDDEECQWRIEISSLQKVGCDENSSISWNVGEDSGTGNTSNVNEGQSSENTGEEDSGDSTETNEGDGSDTSEENNDTSSDNDETDSEWEKTGCNCTGCCSNHGGVICQNGVTVCADGTPLSDTCVENGCEAVGCNGCE